MPSEKRSTGRPYGRAPVGGRGDRTGRKGPRHKRERSGDREGDADALERNADAAPPVVAIVGRPNVGKSTLLNALSHSLVSIVEPTPGVTRDRVSVLATFADRTVEIVDTGGIGIVDTQGLEEHVEAQVATAIRRADVILFVVDARDGAAPLDHVVADRLRRTKAPVILVANKAESGKLVWNLAEFPSLGYGEPLAVSAQEGSGLDRLEVEVGRRLPTGPTTPRRMAAPAMSLAIVGRVNAGKSSLVNALVREDRMIVSEIPGTTRDSVDVRFEKDGEAFVVIDTAGIRKERSVQNSVEFYAQRRAERAIRRADVTALVIDATVDLARLDREIAGLAVNEAHPLLFVVNKWDLAPPGAKTADFVRYLTKTLAGLEYAPVVFTSANTGRNVSRMVEVARSLKEQAATRVPTASLNKAIEVAYATRKPKPTKGKVGRLYYGTQVGVNPPTFVLFVDEPGRFEDAYRRFLENRFREMLPFPEVPIRLRFKARMRTASKNLLGPKPD